MSLLHRPNDTDNTVRSYLWSCRRHRCKASKFLTRHKFSSSILWQLFLYFSLKAICLESLKHFHAQYDAILMQSSALFILLILCPRTRHTHPDRWTPPRRRNQRKSESSLSRDVTLFGFKPEAMTHCWYSNKSNLLTHEEYLGFIVH